MTPVQKLIKYLAIAFAVFLIISIFSGILGLVGLFGVFDGQSAVENDLTQYPVNGNIKSLNVFIGAADITIAPADKFSVSSNLTGLKVNVKKNTLYVEHKQKGNVNYEGAVLTIGIPNGFTFEDVDITTGAGQLTAEHIDTAKLNMTLGAGNTQIEFLNASKNAHISGGAGQILINGGALNDLDMEIGVGKLDMTATLTGECDIDCGIGETVMVLTGDPDQYRIEVDKGIGDVTVDGKHISDSSVYGSGTTDIELNCGIGSVDVKFK